MTDPLGNSATFAYDENGLLTAATDRDYRTRMFVYDDDGQLLTETWYDANGNLVDTLGYSYDGSGNILTAGNNQGTYTLGYDGDSRVTSAVEPFGVTLSFGYDQDGNRTQVGDSFGGTASSSYNSGNLLATSAFTQGSFSIQEGQSSNADNQPTQQATTPAPTPPSRSLTSTPPAITPAASSRSPTSTMPPSPPMRSPTTPPATYRRRPTTATR